MTTKKVAKKSAKKSASKTTARRPVAAAAQPGIPAADPLRVPNETFTTDDCSARTLPAGQVELIVNGGDKGAVVVEGRNLGTFVVDMAQRYGVKSFTVYVDGRKVAQDATNAKLDKVGKIEIVAKDSRA